MDPKVDLEDLENKILNRLYEEADPGLDYDDLRKNPDDYPDDWYSQHKISKRKQDKIIDEVLEQEGVNKDDLPFTFWLNVVTDKSPSYK